MSEKCFTLRQQSCCFWLNEYGQIYQLWSIFCALKLLVPPCKIGRSWHIDAAFGLHDDSKSHTGVVIILDETVVYVASHKQKCVMKSQTDAKLVGLTDNLGLVILFHEFVSFVASVRVLLPLVYQDSTSVITLVTQGGGVTWTKHLRV
jgi:hypothetical protein